jgi:hypothetical protein
MNYPSSVKIFRGFLLLFSFAGCGVISGLPSWGAEDADFPAPAPIAALRAAVAETKVTPEAEPREAPQALCEYLVTGADDFIVEVYQNGKRVPDEQRELLLERFGATVEKIHVSVHEGDWLVFHVVQDRFRWGGAKYFAVAGCKAENEFGFVSDPGSVEWSVCDDPAKVRGFIDRRDTGRNVRAAAIEVPWDEGDDHMKEYAGQDFAGKALWGRQPSTWIKFVPGAASLPEADEVVAEAVEPNANTPGPAPQLLAAKKWPVQILSAIYGTGGKNADVTAKVKEYVETGHCMFAANPKDLGADPNPYWNKGLDIVYMKDGVRREQHRNENEWILPESFYGPQDAGELRAWLPETRWFGEQPDIQFHADQTFTSPGVPGTHHWEATGANSLKLTWSEDHTADYAFDYTWSSFSEAGNAHNVFHLRK